MDMSNHIAEDLPEENKHEAMCQDCDLTDYEKSQCTGDFCPKEM
jgi:hypothetical protein